jgi:hypothetical protein
LITATKTASVFNDAELLNRKEPIKRGIPSRLLSSVFRGMPFGSLAEVESRSSRIQATGLHVATIFNHESQ